MADESQSQVYSNDQLLTLLPSCFCGIVFILLLLFDAWNAFRRRVLWIRGRALVLSALTIQLLSVIDYSSVTYGNSHHQIEEEVAVLLEKDQLLIDSKRLMMCVFIGYLFPSMLILSYEKKWSDIGALALSVTLHMGSELYYVWKYINPKESVLWFTVYCTTLFLAIALLVALFFCSGFASTGLNTIMFPRMNVALLCCSNSPEKRECKNIEDHVLRCPEKRECKNTEDHVLRCWIVARCCHPDFIMVRSIFSAFVGFIVTFCIVIFAVKFSSVHILNNYGKLSNYVRKATLASLFGFVLVGWIVILARWFTAVICFPRVGFYWDESWITYFEDLWIKSVVKRKDDIRSSRKGRLFTEKRIRERRRGKDAIKNLMRPFKLQLLVTAGLYTQIFMVSLSKACWVLSQIAAKMIRPLVMSRENNMLLSGLNMSALESDQFSDKVFCKYKEVLEIIRLPGEMAYSLWIANESPFKQVQNHMNNGLEEGNCKCEKLINLMKVHNLEPPKDQAACTDLEEEKYLQIVGKTSWKMRAVALIHFMIYFYDATKCESKDEEAVNNSIEAYTQAWEFMDMVDSSDSKFSYLLSWAADTEFDTVENIWNRYLKIKIKCKEEAIKLLENKINTPLKADMEKLSKREKPSNLSKEEMEREKLSKEEDKKWSWRSILEKKLPKEEEKLPKEDEKLSKEKTAAGTTSHKNPSVDNLDWIRTAATISRYKTWKNIDQESATIEKLQRSLATLIFHCIKEELCRALIANCTSWANHWKDEEIFNAAFIVGKAKGVLHEMGEDLDESNDAAHKV